jgi:NAD(P)-dependent dehydrogenase (short-subunit alcohol dehydrogenase family)
MTDETKAPTLATSGPEQARAFASELEDRLPEDAREQQKPEGAMQAGARHYPEPPFPAVRQPKPGQEFSLDPAPLYDAPFYRGSGKLEGFATIVTGGDSGIGRSVATLFAREGADVVIVHLGEERDAAEAKAAVEGEGRACITLAGDIADPDFAAQVVAQTVERFGRLDVLVNNAAFQQHVGALEDLGFDQFDRTLATNLRGMFNMVKAAVPHMKSGASIINTGSITGIDGSAALLDYSLTKGGIHAFTRSLGGHLLARGIRVNCVAPGPVWTPLNPSDQAAESVAQFGASAKMKRPAQPEEIAPAFVFLASPQCSSYITGEILPIIGGY